MSSPSNGSGHKPARNGAADRLNRPFKSPVLKPSREGESPAAAATTTPTTTTSTPLTPTTTQSRHALLTRQKRVRKSLESPAKIGTSLSSTCGLASEPKRLKLVSKISSSLCGLEELLRREGELDEEVAGLHDEGLAVEELDRQIDLLHQYNDVKDAAQTVIGRLAELTGVTVKTLHEKYHLPLED